MTKTIYILLMLCSVLCVSAQREDYVWLGGYSSYLGHQIPVHEEGITKLDFNFNPRSVTYDSLGIDFSRAIISYCDTNGHLLFYSNGFQIRNKWDQIVDNGDSINFAYFYYHNSNYFLGGELGTGSDFIVLPVNNNSDSFLFIYNTIDDVSIVQSLRCTLLDMSANQKKGKVLFKDRLLIKDTVINCLSACRHANGRDWWILSQKQKSKGFYRMLMTTSGRISIDYNASMGIYADTASRMEGQSRFSPDGTKYALLDCWGSGIYLYDFNRCSGLLSNPRYLHIPRIADEFNFLAGPIFSPDSRLLYLTTDSFILQFDTYAPDIWATRDTIGIYDSAGETDIFKSYFGVPQQGPDGKIYISHGLSSKCYDIIDSPNIKGKGCKFLLRGLKSISFYGGLPNFQNLRLGRFLGSPCDTLTGLLEADVHSLDLRVYPNPAQDILILDYASVDWSKYASLRLSITDLIGHQVYGYELPRFSALQKVNTADLAQGMYMIDIKDSDGRSICTRKVVKE